MGGRSLPHAVLMMIPEPWENHEQMDPALRAFYQFHLEPDGAVGRVENADLRVHRRPGTMIGAVLDRNGLRPGRYWVTSDGLVVLASEVGVLDIDPATVVRKGRLQPGRIFLADARRRGRIIEDEEVKVQLAAEHPYTEWLHRRAAAPARGRAGPGRALVGPAPDRQLGMTPAWRPAAGNQAAALFGYTEEGSGSSWHPWRAPAASRSAPWAADTPVADALRPAAAW